MAAISAKMVQELRGRTGAGMMECKRALEATAGDVEVAIEKMRKEGMAKADKKAGRVAAEGVVQMAITADGKQGSLVEINSETDFVAKDGNFTAFAQQVGDAALAAGSSEVAQLNELSLGEQSVEEARRALIAKIGENITVRRVHTLTSTTGTVTGYVHGGRIGVLVAISGGDAELGKDVAMHVAASNPPYLDVDAVPEDVRNKEREILISQAEGSGKPRDIIEKMVEGRLRKFLAENTLLGQPFVKDPDTSVEKLLAKAGARVEAFVRFEVGEGIEKEEKDFAAEVAEQAAAAR